MHRPLLLHLPQHFEVQVQGRTWRRIGNLAFDQAADSGDGFNWGPALPLMGHMNELG
jgi:hypothetical protein